MKKLFGTTALVALLTAGPVLAQDATTPAEPATPPAATTPAEPATPPAATTTVAPAAADRFIVLEDGSTDWLASNLIGSTVYSGTDENLGKIVDILATDDGQVKAVVIGVGGFLGIGRKDVAVAPATLERVKTDKDVKLVLATSKEELNAAPEFKTAAQQESDAAKAAAPDTSMPAADPMPPPARDPAAPATAPAAP
ncbi:PRC-barrel domain-containing protein [Kaistia adipata]|uniref:PRC-barrel domain-containing protein n=1 Tax=Kaistia adipata TaxID=166954 RepID=UPI00042220DB|nr:PRC-barrel domain-containing protein [Kaistia adipata]